MSVKAMQASGTVRLENRDLFVGAKIPEEIKVLPKILNSLDQVTFRKLLQGKIFSQSDIS